MADKIVLSDVKSGFNIAVVNDNFSKIEKVVNDNLLWRDQRGISGDNALQSNIDVNSKRLYNLPAPISDFEAARKKDVDDALGGNSGMLEEMQELLDQAEQAVIDASDVSRLTAGTATEGPLSVSIVGPAGSQVLNLTIPAGSGGSSSPGPFLRLDKTTSQDEVIGPSVNAIGINTVIAPGDTVTVDPTSELIIIGQPVDTPDIGLEIHAAASKSIPADADELGLSDSAASWGLKKLTFANLKAWIGGLFVSKSGGTIGGNLNVTGDVLVTGGGGLGYGVGSGGTVTQDTSKGTPVTLNKQSGVITTHAQPLAPGQSVLFDLHSTSAYGCVCVVSVDPSTPEFWNYKAEAIAAGGGAVTFRLSNMAYVSLGANVVLNFALLKIAAS